MKTYYSQNDKKWKNKLLGNSNLKLQNYGCFVVALANLSGIEPDEVNKILKKEKCFDGADIISSKRMANLLGLEYLGRGDKHFGVRYRTIAEVDASKRAGIQKHFVVVKPDGSIIDSWDGKIKPKGTYPIINYRLFKRASEKREAPQSDDKCKEIQSTIEQMKASLAGCYKRNKGLRTKVKILEENVEGLEALKAKEAKEVKIGEAFLFLLQVIKNKIK